jgi:hypothetical protein
MDNRVPPVGITISLRDWFAGQALAGLAGTCMHPGPTNRRLHVEAAYQYADAMLAQRAVKS